MDALKLTYFGNSCVMLVSPGGSRIVSDPYAQRPDGIAPLPSTLTADAVTVSHTHPDHNHVQAVGGNPRVLTEPGVTRVGDVSVNALMGWEGSPDGPSKTMRNVIFVYTVAGIKVVQMGDSGIPTDPFTLNAIGNADLVIVNIDGYVLPLPQVMPFMRRICARTILPAHYTIAGRRVWNGAPTVETFIKDYVFEADIARTSCEFDVIPGMPVQVIVPSPKMLA